ncbi:Carotenoid isomerooxygenase [Fusarium oxysporum f. sp. conglutinans]|nr:Carotenoid isomerooxygenase [Fusarium oxysporum f. sp. conglutinans]
MSSEEKPKGYNWYTITEEELNKFAPPFLRDVPETPKEVECKLGGTWPTWVHGSFLRIGVGRFTIPLSEDDSKPRAVVQHLFDGLGLLHKFRMTQGRVFYMSRRTTEGVVRRAYKDGYLLTTRMGLNANTPLKEAQDPCSTLLGAQQSLYVPTGYAEPDSVNMNVQPRRGMHLPNDKNPYSRGTQSANPATEEILVHTDWNILQVCDARTLEPKRLLNYMDIDPELAGSGSCAHPPHDRKRGLTFNYLIDASGVLFVFALDVASNPAALVWKSPLPCRPCYTHALAMTDKYVVFVRNPVHLDLSDTTKGFADMMVCEHNSPTEFYILDKSDGKHVATYQVNNFYFFHIGNAYDYIDPKTGDVNIHVDIVSYREEHYPYMDYSISNLLDPKKPLQNGTLVRYQMDSVNKADPAKICRGSVASAIAGLPCELPRVSKPASMDPNYRYTYGISGIGASAPGTEVPIGRLSNGLGAVHPTVYGSLFKSDWKTGLFKLWTPSNGESCPTEPIFIQRPGATEEDDGIVITITINREGTHSILVGLDGKTFKEVARADMPQVYALGPHGSFVEGDFGL